VSWLLTPMGLRNRRTHMDAPPSIAPEVPVQPLPPHPRLAIVAFLVALASAGIIFGVSLFEHLIGTIDGGQNVDRQEQLRNPVGVVFFAALLADVVAIAMAGLSLARSRRRLFPILALTIGLLVFSFCFVGFFI
jgi:hypothetical protein